MVGRTFTLALLALFAVSAVQSMQVGKNFSLVLVGGGLLDDNAEIWNTIINLAGGKGAKFGVVNAASGDPCCDKDSAFVFYDAMLRLYGAGSVYFIPVTVDSKVQLRDSNENFEHSLPALIHSLHSLNHSLNHSLTHCTD
jgi:hypothetical protein